MSSVADMLRRHRGAKRWSQGRCARECDLDYSLVSRIESGTRNATRESIRKLALGLGLGVIETDRLYLAAGFIPPDTDPQLLERLLSFIREARAQSVSKNAA